MVKFPRGMGGKCKLVFPEAGILISRNIRSPTEGKNTQKMHGARKYRIYNIYSSAPQAK